MTLTLISVEFTQFFDADKMTKNMETALIRAVNLAATKGRTNAAKAVREQVRFPASYLSPSEGRLSVSQKARSGAIEAVISGRDRATSLARFVRNQTVLSPAERAKRRTPGVDIQVKPGRGWKKMKRAFVIRLNNDNLGLAIRTDGAAPTGAHRPKPIGKNLWLLYGPSVDQTLISAATGRGVFEEMSPELLEILESEYHRQMGVLEKNNG